MVMQAFIDDSADRTADQVLVMAGYIASVETWAAFSAEWDDYLRVLGIDAFKMSSDLGPSTDPDRWLKYGHLYRIIERHLSSGVAVAIEVDPLKRVVSELGLPDHLLNPYVLGYRSLLEGTAQYQGDLGIEEPIDFVFDERPETEKQSVRSGLEILKQREKLGYRHRFGVEPRFEKDEFFPPLQAADMLAWIVRRHWMKYRTITKTMGLEFPWRPTTDDMKIYAFNMDYPDIRSTLESSMRALHAAGHLGLMTLTVSFSCDLSWPPKDEAG